MKTHPIAEIFPLLEGVEFDGLVADIKAHGLIHPIVTFEDQILDGRNRWRACKSAKAEPRFERFRGKDPVSYVISTNITRRHLSDGARAIAAARLATLSQGRPEINRPIGLFTQDEASKRLNVGLTSVKRAQTVLDTGNPELIAAVNGGHMAVSAAAKVAERTLEEQKRIVAKVLSGEIKPNSVVSSMRLADKRALAEKIRKAPIVTPDGRYQVIAITGSLRCLLYGRRQKKSHWESVQIAGKF